MGILLSCPNFSREVQSGDSLDSLQYHITKQNEDLEKLKLQTLEQNEELEVVRAQSKSHVQAIELLQNQIQELSTQLDEQDRLFNLIKEENQPQKEDIATIKNTQQDRIKHLEVAILEEEKVKNEEPRPATPTEVERVISTATFIWRLENFEYLQKKARIGKQQVINSEPFYSERHGYKMKVRMYPNGRGEAKENHLSLYIVIAHGEYDAMLPWPFVRKVTLSVLDQEEDSSKRKNISGSFEKIDAINCFGRPEMVENEAYGFQKMIKLKDLQDKKFVVKGVVFIRVDVEAE